jgi:hypothetical protein
MKSLDLFTGIGGFTVALGDLGVKPILYCENDPTAQRVLRDLIQKGKLPSAPIHDDVRTLSVRRGVDLITAGFPCQGFSTAGDREGLRHNGSGLVSHIFRLMKSTSPKAVFLENVPALLSDAHADDFRKIVAKFSSLGYDGRYIIMHGYDVQCPQKRKRVYLLFYKRGATLPGIRQKNIRKRRFSWATEPVPRMVLGTWSVAKQYRLLGNSVIPELTKLAFLMLWSGMTQDAATLYKQKTIPFVHDSNVPRLTSKSDLVCAGLVSRKTQMPVPKPATFAVTYTPPTFTLDPNVYTSSKQNKATTPVLKGPVSLTGWNTIHTNMGTNSVLTQRSSLDIGTQLRFARDTPARLRKGRPNPEFFEFLMGYPTGWTKAAQKR